jgi:hypothetical protein
VAGDGHVSTRVIEGRRAHSGQGAGLAGGPAGCGVSKKMEAKRAADSEDAQGLLAQAGAVAGGGMQSRACMLLTTPLSDDAAAFRPVQPLPQAP